MLTLLHEKDFKLTNIGYTTFLAKGATLAFFYHTTSVGGGSREGLRAEQEIQRKGSSNCQTHLLLPNSQSAAFTQ